MASQRPAKIPKPLLTMHDWEAKHYLLAGVIILVVMGLFGRLWLVVGRADQNAIPSEVKSSDASP